MSLLVMIEVQVKPENVPDIKSFLAKALPDTRAYNGCQRVDVYSDPEDSGNMVFLTHWDSRAHYEKYHAWRTETGAPDQFGAILTGPPSRRYFERVDV